MKKNYSTPTTEEVQLLTNASLMQMVEGSNTGVGSDNDEKGDDEIEYLAGRSRGNWGNLW